jgi:SAM-dependent methyltransferase
MEYERLVQLAIDHQFSGWDFSWAEGRWHEREPNWNYRQLVLERVGHSESMLDMGTGGGEFLSSLEKIPEHTCATEGYSPNISIAKKNLHPRGVEVVPVSGDNMLPFDTGTFDLVINRHESFDLSEVWRVLKPQGIFLTQQVGPNDCIGINQFLEAPIEPDNNVWHLSKLTDQVKDEGYKVIHCQEQYLDSTFHDIGAVVLFLRIIEWQIPDFTVEKYDQRLRAMHKLINLEGEFVVKAHRYLVEAQKI